MQQRDLSCRLGQQIGIAVGEQDREIITHARVVAWFTAVTQRERDLGWSNGLSVQPTATECLLGEHVQMQIGVALERRRLRLPSVARLAAVTVCFADCAATR